MSVLQLRSQLSGQRCKSVLKTIFADKDLGRAVGAAYQLRNIDTAVDPPPGLLKMLKQDAMVRNRKQPLPVPARIVLSSSV